MADAVPGSERRLTPEERLELARRHEERAATRRRPPRLLPRHHRVAAPGPLAQPRHDAGRARRPRQARDALREGGPAPRLRAGARAGARAPRRRGARALRRLPRAADRRAPGRAAGSAPAAFDPVLSRAAVSALLRARGLPLVRGARARDGCDPRGVARRHAARRACSERVFASDDAERRGLAGAQGAPTWNGFYFYRHGERREANHALCPRTVGDPRDRCRSAGSASTHRK